MKIKSKLQNLQQGNSSLKDYFSQVKKCVDALAAVGKPISVEDHTIYILSGLESEFESMISVIAAKSGPQSVQEVMALLLTQENRNESKKHVISSDGTPHLANLLTHAANVRKENHAPRNPNTHGSQNRGRGRTNKGGKQWTNRSRIQCQLCGKFCHTAVRCYSHFDPRFQGPNSSGSSGVFP